MKNTGLTLLLVLLSLGSPGLSAQTETQELTNPMVILSTNHGDITLELFAEEAPLTVANFLAYVNDGFYDGTIFHRVIAGFMMQGGGFNPGMAQKTEGAPIQNEANNGLKNIEGTIAMARTSDPHSAAAQFFINSADNDSLDFSSETPNGWGYTVFGKVSDGMNVVTQISLVQTGLMGGHGDVPLEDVVLVKAGVIEPGVIEPEVIE
jgi:peptidyl-prolyl cis-trans isomerase B (cyclophilin B)